MPLMTSSLGDRLEGHWLLLHTLAITAATVHAITDWHIGLFGASSSVVSPPQAGLAFGMSLLTALWAIGLGWAALEEARGHATVFIIALLWAFLGNGVVIAACPPPCLDGFPYQDISHVGGLVFGAAAAWVSWRQLKQADGNPGWFMPVVTFGVIVGVLALEAFLAG